MKIKEVLCALEKFAPLPLQESWDNAGLQIGLTETEVSGALLCLDVNERIIDEAVRKGCNLIVSHHPLLFRGLKTISDLTDVQRTVRKAKLPHMMVIDLGSEQILTGFDYLPRAEQSAPGSIRSYRLFVY